MWQLPFLVVVVVVAVAAAAAAVHVHGQTQARGPGRTPSSPSSAHAIKRVRNSLARSGKARTRPDDEQAGCRISRFSRSLAHSSRPPLSRTINFGLRQPNISDKPPCQQRLLLAAPFDRDVGWGRLVSQTRGHPPLLACRRQADQPASQPASQRTSDSEQKESVAGQPEVAVKRDECLNRFCQSFSSCA